MPVKINSSGGGAVTLAAAGTGSEFTHTLPAVSGTVVTTGSSAVVTPAMMSTGSPSWDTSGNLSFNSGFGSVGLAYGCRAWVNFNGTAASNLSGTYSQSGTTVTVTATAHGLIAGSIVFADITTGTGVDGTYTVATVTGPNTFTYTAGTSLTTSGNITLVRNTIRGSGNVSSITDNGVGDYTVNFSTAMPDANYSCVGSAQETVAVGSVNRFLSVDTVATTGARVFVSYTGTLFDPEGVHVAIFR